MVFWSLILLYHYVVNCVCGGPWEYGGLVMQEGQPRPPDRSGIFFCSGTTAAICLLVCACIGLGKIWNRKVSAGTRNALCRLSKARVNAKIYISELKVFIFEKLFLGNSLV